MAAKPYGSLVPFSEQGWARGLPSPYYNESHAKLRSELRTWLYDEVEIMENIHEWAEEGQLPPEVYQQAAKLGIVACVRRSLCESVHLDSSSGLTPLSSTRSCFSSFQRSCCRNKNPQRSEASLLEGHQVARRRQTRGMEWLSRPGPHRRAAQARLWRSHGPLCRWAISALRWWMTRISPSHPPSHQRLCRARHRLSGA